MMKQILIIFTGLICACNLFCQTAAADSLRALLNEATEKDTLFVRRQLELSAELMAGDARAALILAEESLDLAHKLDYPYGINSATYRLGRARYELVEYDLVEKHILSALEMSEVNNLPALRVEIYNLQGSLYDKQNRRTEAVAIFLKMIDLADSLDMRWEMMAGKNNIANIYYYQGLRKEAKAAYAEVLELAKEFNDPLNEAIVYTNLADMATDSAEAFDYLHQALPRFADSWFKRGVGHVHMSMAEKYLDYGRPETAILHFDSAAALFETTGFKLGLANNSVGRAKAYNQTGRFGQAIRSLGPVLPLILESGNKEILVKAYTELSDAHAGLGNYRAALDARKEMDIAKDSLYSAETTATIAELNTKYETEQNRARLAQQEVELSQQELELARQSNLRTRILIGAVLIILILTALFQYFRNRQHMRQKEIELAAQLEKAEAEKLREMDKLKSNFFANISHEFRTPLTLILSPLRQMREGTFKEDLQKYYGIMERNGQRLMSLVNQLLDLSRLESGRMELQPVPGDLVGFVRAIAFSFESLAVRKQIRYDLALPETALEAHFDRDKLEKILTNLLSNAFKFTPEEGAVRFTMDLKKETGGADVAHFKIEDSGIGIPEAALPHIFERFYQAGADNELQTGSGIGLTLTKELIDLHGGHMQVDSREGVGSTFAFSIDLGEATATAGPEASEATTFVLSNTAKEDKSRTIASPIAVATKSIGKQEDGTPLLLIVEDNPELRSYIIEQFGSSYRILEAEHGRLGLEQALEAIPDLIITDLMMPEMDGLSLCRELKQNEKTSHIPVLMLTAKAEREDKLEGLEIGADDYLVKPFDAVELQLKVRNFIGQQKRLQEHLAGQHFSFQPGAVEVSSVDEQFLRKVRSAIVERLDDETFSVVELGKAVGMSRSQLHRKLKAITGQGPNEIIREMRLLRAKELLEKGAGNASEVAFMVGFNSLAYFSRCFSDRFERRPSEILGSR